LDTDHQREVTETAQRQRNPGRAKVPPEARKDLLEAIRLGLELQHACAKAQVPEQDVRADPALMDDVAAAYRHASARFRERMIELALKRPDTRLLAEAAAQREAAALALSPRAPKMVTHPSCKQLANLRGVRRQLVQLFREAKAGMIDPTLFGRLVNALNVVQAIDNGKLIDERMDALEAKLTALKPNGHAGREARL
jgi:hypothetical protein